MLWQKVERCTKISHITNLHSCRYKNFSNGQESRLFFYYYVRGCVGSMMVIALNKHLPSLPETSSPCFLWHEEQRHESNSQVQCWLQYKYNNCRCRTAKYRQCPVVHYFPWVPCIPFHTPSSTNELHRGASCTVQEFRGAPYRGMIMKIYCLVYFGHMMKRHSYWQGLDQSRHSIEGDYATLCNCQLEIHSHHPSLQGHHDDSYRWTRWTSCQMRLELDASYLAVKKITQNICTKPCGVEFLMEVDPCLPSPWNETWMWAHVSALSVDWGIGRHF